MKGYTVLLLKMPSFEAVFELGEALDTLWGLEAFGAGGRPEHSQHLNADATLSLSSAYQQKLDVKPAFPHHGMENDTLTANDRCSRMNSGNDRYLRMNSENDAYLKPNSGNDGYLRMTSGNNEYLRMNSGNIKDWEDTVSRTLNFTADPVSDRYEKMTVQDPSWFCEHDNRYVDMTANLSIDDRQFHDKTTATKSHSLREPVRTLRRNISTYAHQLLPSKSPTVKQKYDGHSIIMGQSDRSCSSSDRSSNLSTSDTRSLSTTSSYLTSISSEELDDALEYHIDTKENIDELAFVQRLQIKANNLTPKLELYIKMELRELLEMHNILLSAFQTKNLTKILIYFQNNSSKFANYVKCIDYLSVYNKKTTLNVEFIHRLSTYRTFLTNIKLDCESELLRVKCDKAISALEKVLQTINDRMILWNIDQDKVNLLKCGEVLMQGILEQVDKKMEKIYTVLMTKIILFLEVGTRDYVTHTLTEKISYVDTRHKKKIFVVTVDAKIGIGSMSLRVKDSDDYDKWIRLIKTFEEENRRP